MGTPRPGGALVAGGESALVRTAGQKTSSDTTHPLPTSHGLRVTDPPASLMERARALRMPEVRPSMELTPAEDPTAGDGVVSYVRIGRAGWVPSQQIW
jgi:hypothetical protein